MSTQNMEVENLIPKKHAKQPDFGVGTRLWRPVEATGSKRGVTQKEIQSPIFEKDRQSYIVRATWGQGFTNHGWVAVGTNDRGLVCFCRDEIPEDWTYFEVTKVADNKKSAFVKPVVGPEDELLEQYY